MARINIKLPDDLHVDLKKEAADREKTLKDTVIDMIKNGVEKDE